MAVRRWWAELVRAQELHAARYDLSGTQARAATEQLRWRGDRLVGEVLAPSRPAGCCA